MIIIDSSSDEDEVLKERKNSVFSFGKKKKKTKMAAGVKRGRKQANSGIQQRKQAKVMIHSSSENKENADQSLLNAFGKQKSSKVILNKEVFGPDRSEVWQKQESAAQTNALATTSFFRRETRSATEDDECQGAVLRNQKQLSF